MEMASGDHVKVDELVTENGEKPGRKLKKTVLDNFSNLVNKNEKIRVRSSVNLLRHLAENENAENENELKYALGRIIRGLGSSSVPARTGFYTALVALINSKDVGLDDIFDHLNKELHKGGGNSKGENADVSVGQILACGAIIRSTLWAKTSEDEQNKIWKLLLKASKERAYLSLVGYMFVVNKLEELNEKEFRRIFPIIKEEFSKQWSEQNIDTLYFLMCVNSSYPNLVNKNFLVETIGTEEIICSESMEQLCSVLMTIPRLTALKHPIYELIGKELAKSEHLLLFLKELDKNLQRPNRNKQLVVAKIFTIILQNVGDTNLIPSLLTKNFIQQALIYFKTFTGKNKDPEFQQSTHTFFATLVEAVKPEKIKPKTKIAVLKKLLFYPGTFIFEKITKSKIIQQITFSLDGEGVKRLAEVYEGVVEGTEKIDSENADNENWLNNDRLYAAHLVIKLLNHPSVKGENDWKAEQLKFLMKLGLFKAESRLSIGCELSVSLKSAFFGALDLKLSKLEDLQVILLQLVDELDSKLSPDDLDTVLRSPIAAEEYETWQKTVKIVRKIEKKKRKGLKSVFLTLFLHMALQLFNDSKLASEALKELFVCYEKTRKNRKNSENTVTEADGETEDADPLWIEVVTDLFLNLLSHNYHLLRSLIKSVFPHLCDHMTPTTIHQLLSVIDPKNEDNPLSKYSEESSDDETDSREATVTEENESESEDDDESEPEDAVEDESVNDKLRMALHRVLSGNGYQTDEESVDLDQLSDVEGENLNKALAEAFVQFKPNLGKRKKQSKDQEALMHFRVRVLDLIEIYLESTPSMILTLEIMLPLLQAVEFSIRDPHQKPLHDRLKACLKKLSALKKFSDADGVDETVLSDLLRSLLEKGTKNSMIIQDMGVQIADCCIFIIRCSDLLISSKETPKKTRKKLKSAIAEIISNELQNYFHKRDCLTPYVLFKNALQLTWDGMLSLVPSLLDYVFSESIKPFKKNQAAELLKIFYTNQRYLNQNAGTITETLAEEHLKFSQNVIALFGSLCQNPAQKSVKEKYVCNLFQLLSAIKSGLNLDGLGWVEIAESVREYRSHVSFSKDAKMAFNKLCNHLGVSHLVKMQSRATALSNSTEDLKESVASKPEPKRGKKRKGKNKEQLKLKKEAKELRLKSLSEGFGDVAFNAARGVDVNESGGESDVSESFTHRKVQDRENGELEGRHKVNGALGSSKTDRKRKKYNDIDSGKDRVNGTSENVDSGTKIGKRKNRKGGSEVTRDRSKPKKRSNDEDRKPKRKKIVH